MQMTKVGGTVDSFKSREALWRDGDKSEGWTIATYMEFNKSSTESRAWRAKCIRSIWGPLVGAEQRS